MPTTDIIETEVASMEVVIQPSKETMEVTLKKDDMLAVDISANNKLGITDMLPSVASDYNKLFNKPQINEVELIGNKTGKQLGLQDKMDSLTNLELDELIKF